MKLSSAIELHAGGPGSGRRKVSEILEDKGYKRSKGSGIDEPAAIYHHPDTNHKIAIDDRYQTWKLGEHEGSGSADLEKKLSTLYSAKGKKKGFYSPVTMLRDKMTMTVNQDTGELSPPKQVKSAEERVEREDGPIQHKSGKSITQRGTQFCVSTNGPDELGCYPSKEKARAVAQGRSFIETDIVKAGGPGSGRHPEINKVHWHNRLLKQAFELDLGKGQGYWAVPIGGGRLVGSIEPLKGSVKDCRALVKQLSGREGFDNVRVISSSGGQHTVAWGDKDILSELPARHRAHDHVWLGRAYGFSETSIQKHVKSLKLDAEAFPVMPKFKDSNPYVTPGQKKSKPAGPNQLGLQHLKKMKADAGGEPMAGNMAHAHLDTNLWFTPPSLAKRGKGNHIPTDDPMETDDKFLDVTKRKANSTKEERMKILRRGIPSGDPPRIPARTTLSAPNMAYMPGVFASAIKLKPRKDLMDARMRRAYGAAKI